MQSITVQDVTVPALGFGTWELTGDTSYRAVRAALEVGYRHVDTAQGYGNEEEVGRALADSGLDRDEVFLTTKVWMSKARADDVRRTHENSLRRLGTDHVDLLLIHWPTDVAPIEETLEAMDGLRQQGRTRLIGVSNYPSQLLRRAREVAPVVTDQVEYHPYLDQTPVLDAVREHDGMFLTAYSPLAHGEAIGDETLGKIGADHGKSAPQVALRWLLQQDRVAALPRSSDPEHVAANADVFDFELSDDEMQAIHDLARPDGRRIDPPFAPDWD